MLRRMTWLSVVVFALMMTAGTAMAQRGGGGAGGAGGAGGGGGRRGGGNFDPAAQMANTLDLIQQQLGATDQEWAVLKPKVEKVVTARNEVQAGNRGGRGGGGRRGGGGPGGNQQTPTTAVAQALLALENTLQDPNATAEQISQRLTTLREAKAKAAATLAAAQKDLKDLLTARQEAILVTMSYLE